jgi:hypothetical protein
MFAILAVPHTAKKTAETGLLAKRAAIIMILLLADAIHVMKMVVSTGQNAQILALLLPHNAATARVMPATCLSVKEHHAPPMSVFVLMTLALQQKLAHQDRKMLISAGTKPTLMMSTAMRASASQKSQTAERPA